MRITHRESWEMQRFHPSYGMAAVCRGSTQQPSLYSANLGTDGARTTDKVSIKKRENFPENSLPEVI
jgi:hypothetical protein